MTTDCIDFSLTGKNQKRLWKIVLQFPISNRFQPCGNKNLFNQTLQVFETYKVKLLQGLKLISQFLAPPSSQIPATPF